MDKLKRREYNRQFYLLNRERILGRSKKTKKPPTTVVRIASRPEKKPKSIFPKTRVRFRRTNTKVETAVLAIATVLMSSYLIYASFKFYYGQDLNFAEAFVKAIIAEGVVFLFSFLRASTQFETILFRSLAFFGAAFCILTISMGQIRLTLDLRKQNTLYETILSTIQQSLNQQLNARSRYIRLDRPTLARRYDANINTLHQQIKKLNEDIKRNGDSDGLLWLLITLMIFRVIVVFSNAICLK